MSDRRGEGGAVAFSQSVLPVTVLGRTDLVIHLSSILISLTAHYTLHTTHYTLHTAHCTLLGSDPSGADDVITAVTDGGDQSAGEDPSLGNDNK